ncbi:MAG: PDZ domain-containing protein [Nocardioidaceae bacterium]|nr:PDZ domain-containing protein [Nocardioidaceae bacterium]
MATRSYLRFPHVRGDQVVFVAENDIWLAGTGGGRAFRITTDQRPATSPRFSPDGSKVAWTANRDGANEVYVAPLDGGVSKRLTFWGQVYTKVRGWVSDDEVLVLSTTGEAERSRVFAHAVPVDGSASRRLPYGWVHDIAMAPTSGGVLVSTPVQVEPAWWKRYRGGTAGQLWLDLTGEGRFKRIFADLSSGLVSPVWTVGDDGRQHIGLCSDHEGRGQVYSAVVGSRAPSTNRLTRHTDHHEFYARHATTDGRQVVYQAGGSLHLLDSLDSEAQPRELDISLGGARSALQPQAVKAGPGIETISPDISGRASAVETRGTIQWVAHRDGPVRALADGSAARRRLPVVLGDSGRVAWVTDADGDDAVEVVGTEDADATAATLVAAGKVGRVLEMAASPDGRRVAIASHDGRLLTVAVPEGAVTRSATVREVDTTRYGDVSGLAFSPDSRWLAWSAPGPEPLRHIRMADVGGRGRPFDVTPLRFTDSDPVFTIDGKHLAFLSIRSLDPVYDAFVFDLSFPNGCRPHLVPLAADTPSPFDPRLGGRPPESPDEHSGGAKPGGTAGEAVDGRSKDAKPAATRVDLDGIEQRITAVPVAGGRYSALRAVQGGLVWLKHPLGGVVGDDRAKVDDEPSRASVEHVDLATGKTQTLVETADSIATSGDGARLVVNDHGELVVLPANRKVDKDSPEAKDGPDHVKVDLDRVRVQVEPAAEWRQMYHETWRLMRDHFWRADMGGVDWEAARDRYAPLLDRIGAHDDLIDLIWEMHGELGSSHAYCMPAPDDPDTARRQGLLGADLEFSGGQWRVARVVPGEASERRARSPLAAPGVGAKAGDAIVAVDGRPTGELVSPMSLLVGTANKPVELTIAAAGGGARRRVVVVPLADEFPLRYQDWVNDRRAYVHAKTGDRIGYLHVPDMVSGGWAQLHRDLRTEVNREALILDVRANRGGHTSQLVVEKLARKIIGWDLARGNQPESYPGDSRRGPMVTVTDMYAGSDGDIVTAAIRALELGPVIGTRTWGGVIGIDGRYHLVDKTMVTQPRYSFWFEQFGWGVENYGVDPDVEVVATPQDQVNGDDVQLDHAIDLVQKLLKKTPALDPPPLPPV